MSMVVHVILLQMRSLLSQHALSYDDCHGGDDGYGDGDDDEVQDGDVNSLRASW